jgi:hypothetical protein
MALHRFSMPTPVKITGRSSSITNSFVNGIIPVIEPTHKELEEACSILGMEYGVALHCVYCGGDVTEWDHLRPIVKNQRPTGYISEIRNLVPACGTCNQSKGNRDWRAWMEGKERTRLRPGYEDRVLRLEHYEQWGNVQPVDLSKLVSADAWTAHWENWRRVLDVMKESQPLADQIREAIRRNYRRQDDL